MPSISLNGELFHYASVGEGSPFVFQHGMGADVAQPLSSGRDLVGWRTIAMDCRGHGQTEANIDSARISFAQFANDLRFFRGLRGEKVAPSGQHRVRQH